MALPRFVFRSIFWSAAPDARMRPVLGSEGRARAPLVLVAMNGSGPASTAALCWLQYPLLATTAPIGSRPPDLAPIRAKLLGESRLVGMPQFSELGRRSLAEG